MKIYPALEIPDTLAADPSLGNIDPIVRKRLTSTSVADHMRQDVLRGMVEAKHMLRDLFGTKNVHTFGVGGGGFNGLDCVLSMILPGDKVVVFVNGTFSGLDSLTIRMTAATPADLAKDLINPQPQNVVIVNVPHGESVTGETVASALAEHQPMWAFMAHWETGSGRINDIQGFNDACAQHEVMGIIDAVSSLGIADFDIDDYPAVVAWVSFPQKGVLSLPMTYAPVSFRDAAIDVLRQRGCYTGVYHPIREARHWGIIEGADVAAGTYHSTHSPYAIAAVHEALRLLLTYGRARKAADYIYYEGVLRHAVQQMGCEVTSDMTSLVVLNLPGKLAGSEKELIGKYQPEGFGIWPTLPESVQVRIGILNQLTESAIRDIVSRFADAMLQMGAEFDKTTIMNDLYSPSLAAA